MKTLRTALVGLGRIGWNFHLPQMNKHPGFTPVAVVDTDPTRLEEARQQYGVAGFTDIAEMLDAVHPDLTVIASPTHLHRQHAILAMEKGSDVFLDKPMAPDVTAADEIAAAAARLGRKLMVFQPHRSYAEASVLRRILKSGVLGALYLLKRGNTGYNRRSDWQALKKYGGGMLNNYGAHYIDQLFWLCGCNQVDSLFCRTNTVATLGDADDVVKAVLCTANGICLDLDISQAAALSLPPLQAFGRFGSALLTKDAEGNPCYQVRYLVPEELPPLSLDENTAAQGRLYSQDTSLPWHEETLPVTPADAITYYDKCYEYYALDLPPFVPVEETLQVMRTIARCRQSAEENN